MVVDKTAPTVSNVNLGTDAEGNKVLTFTAGDDQYMSAVVSGVVSGVVSAVVSGVVSAVVSADPVRRSLPP